MIEAIQSQLVSLSNPDDAVFLQRFFKTGPGQYGEGDIFRGIRVPVLRRLSRNHQNISLKFVEQLLCSAYHQQMPRTMLRYAIEKFPQEKRLRYLKGW
jgi:hypothetical protein